MHVPYYMMQENVIIIMGCAVGMVHDIAYESTSTMPAQLYTYTCIPHALIYIFCRDDIFCGLQEDCDVH